MERVAGFSVLPRRSEKNWSLGAAFAAMVVLLLIGPFVVYPVFLMKALCFSLFACAFNLLIASGDKLTPLKRSLSGFPGRILNR